jgi:hypothetical protein
MFNKRNFDISDFVLESILLHTHLAVSWISWFPVSLNYSWKLIYEWHYIRLFRIMYKVHASLISCETEFECSNSAIPKLD